MKPALRVVPASPAQRAADPSASLTVYFGEDIATLVLATSAVGLGISVAHGEARVAGTGRQFALLRDELTTRQSHLAETLDRHLSPQTAWRLRSRELSLERALIMGILNLTADSFSGDGVGQNVSAALRRAEELRAAGADIIDVGAESARADRPVLEAGAEAALVSRVIAALSREGHCVSSDTYKAEVARAALEAGAEIVNDISGLTLGTGAAEEAAGVGAGYVLNYSYSAPKRRPDAPPTYDDVVTETLAWMFERVARLRALGLADAQIAIDPGIAFGKSHDEDLQVLRRVGEFTSLGLPVLLAHSRKNFIGSVNGRPPPERDLETHIASVLTFEQGVRIFRVHDVEGTHRALQIASAIASGAPGDYAPDETSWPWAAGSSAAHMTAAQPDKAAPAGQRW